MFLPYRQFILKFINFLKLVFSKPVFWISVFTFLLVFSLLTHYKQIKFFLVNNYDVPNIYGILVCPFLAHGSIVLLFLIILTDFFTNYNDNLDEVKKYYGIEKFIFFCSFNRYLLRRLSLFFNLILVFFKKIYVFLFKFFFFKPFIVLKNYFVKKTQNIHVLWRPTFKKPSYFGIFKAYKTKWFNKK